MTSAAAEMTFENDPLDAVIAAYLQQVEIGARPDRAALLASHTDLADRLRAFFEDLDRVDRQAGELVLSSKPNHSSNSSEPRMKLPRDRYFGDYELIDVIARGGMGVVYKARQLSLNRVVALKMILKGELAGPRDVERFKAEAAAAANLDHPNIVPIYEVGEHDGLYYYAMRYIEGKSLAELPRGAYGDEAALLSKIARAVQHAHQRGILHRDLKPSNVLVEPNGTPLVTDFGLAKRLTADPENELTASGAFVGTPRYMAPEQAEGRRDLSVAADVYSLGVILYQRLTGRPPFVAESIWELLAQVREALPPRPSTLVARLDRDLETVCLKCLEKDPSRRYASPEELAAELDRWQRGESILARPAGRAERTWRWCRRKPVLACVLLAGVTAVISAIMVSTRFAAGTGRESERARASEQTAREISPKTQVKVP